MLVDLSAVTPLAVHVDRDGDGDTDEVLPGSTDTLFAEGLRVVSVRQLESSFFAAPGDIRDPATYGLLVAVLFNKPTQEAIMKAAATAETRGWKMWEDKAGWYLDQLKSHGMIVQPPSAQLSADLKKLGDQLTADWLKKAGADGEAVVAAYRK